MSGDIEYSTRKQLAIDLKAHAEMDAWQEVDFEKECSNEPESRWADAWEDHIDVRMIFYTDETMDLSFSPESSSEMGCDLYRGKVEICPSRIAWLAPQHRETIQEVIDEVLQAYAPGVWEVDDCDELHELPRNGIVATLAGRST